MLRTLLFVEERSKVYGGNLRVGSLAAHHYRLDGRRRLSGTGYRTGRSPTKDPLLPNLENSIQRPENSKITVLLYQSMESEVFA
jgi:hypothetical protein